MFALIQKAGAVTAFMSVLQGHGAYKYRWNERKEHEAGVGKQDSSRLQDSFDLQTKINPKVFFLFVSLFVSES